MIRPYDTIKPVFRKVKKTGDIEAFWWQKPVSMPRYLVGFSRFGHFEAAYDYYLRDTLPASESEYENCLDVMKAVYENPSVEKPHRVQPRKRLWEYR